MIVVALGIALVLAMVVLVLGAGRMVFGIARYYLRERRPARQYRHPEFGVFTSDGDLWSCDLRRNGRELRLVLGGEEGAPSQGLVAHSQRILGGLASVERQAIDFLKNREPELRGASLEAYCLCFADKRRPDDYSFEFIESGDDSRVWRVEFIDGAPMETGFDD